MNLLAAIIGVLGMALVMAIILGVIIMLLWNAFMPQVLGLPEITYVQGVVLYFLCALLFKNHETSKED